MALAGLPLTLPLGPTLALSSELTISSRAFLTYDRVVALSMAYFLIHLFAPKNLKVNSYCPSQTILSVNKDVPYSITNQ